MKRLIMKNAGFILFICLLFISINALSLNKSNRIFKNLGSLINTTSNEFQPVIFNDTLYFRRTDDSHPNDDDIFFIAMKDITCPSTNSSKMNSIKLYKLKTSKSKDLL